MSVFWGEFWESTASTGQSEPTHVEVRSLRRHGEPGSLGETLTTTTATAAATAEGGAVGETVCLAVLERLAVTVHGTLEEMKRGGT